IRAASVALRSSLAKIVRTRARHGSDIANRCMRWRPCEARGHSLGGMLGSTATSGCVMKKTVGTPRLVSKGFRRHRASSLVAQGLQFGGTLCEHCPRDPNTKGRPHVLHLPRDRQWNDALQAVKFGVGVGEYEGVVRVRRRVLQRLVDG